MLVTQHHPNYLPWIGLFSKIAQADCYLMTDVWQFTRHSVTNRGKVRTKEGWGYLTIPISRNQYTRRIYEVVMPDDERWQTNHWKTICQCYERTPFFSRYKAFFEQLYGSHFEYMSQMTIEIIRYLLDCFEIKAQLRKASDLGVDLNGPPTDVIIALSKATGADSYLSGPSGTKYLEPDKFPLNNMVLKYASFEHPVYRQRYPGFEPNMSAIDLLFNLGPEAGKIIKDSGSITDYVVDVPSTGPG